MKMKNWTGRYLAENNTFDWIIIRLARAESRAGANLSNRST